MVIINSFNTLINNLLIVQPTGFWEKIIIWFTAGIKNYAWAVIILTLIIKVLMTPLDFYNKKFTRKNAKMQQAIKPELDILRKKYGNDKQLMNQKTMELYKKHNYNMGGSCVFMLINMALTFTIFISLLNGLNSMADYKISQQYEDLQVAYYNVQTIEEVDNSVVLTEDQLVEANKRVLNKYNQIKDSWLWIENVWIADSPLSNAIPKYDEYAKIAKLETEQIEDETLRAEYDKIMNPLRDSYDKKNGYFILLILIVGITVVQQLTMFSRIRFKKKNILDNEEKISQPTNKSMMIVLPIMLGVFALISNSVFSLYLLVSAGYGALTTPLIITILYK